MSKKRKKNTITEATVDGRRIGEAVQNLIQLGNERLFVVRSKAGQELFSLPLTAAVVIGVVGVLFVLPLTIGLAALAYLLRLRFEIVRLTKDGDDTIIYSESRKSED
jgi:hypothetical protein